MVNYNLNSVNSNFKGHRAPFENENINYVSNPIDSKEQPKQSQEFATREFATPECAYATKATAMAQILIGNDIKPNMTQKEYVDKLIKQGKIPNTDFFIAEKSYGCGYNSQVVEVNRNGERIKEVRFFDDGNIGCMYVNPKTQKIYKTIETLEGKLHISNNNPTTEEPISDEVYSQDGKLEQNAFYKNPPNGEA